MYTIYKQIDNCVLSDIQKYEEFQLLNFKNDFESSCSKICKIYNWHYTICIDRWEDISVKWKKSILYDGYTATLQIDFMNKSGDLIEIDERRCSFFENITFISYNPFFRKYRVFQNEKLKIIRAELNQFISNFE